MQYILAAHTDEEQQEQGAAAFVAYIRDLAKAGVLVGNYRPEPSAPARTVRFVDGGAERHPAARIGAIEVRPVSRPGW